MAIDIAEVRRCAIIMFDRYVRDDPWPETMELMDVAPIQAARHIQRSLGVGPIMHNRAQCLNCLEIIESMNRHDYVTCSCGHTSVDGGSRYLRRAGLNNIDMSENWPWIITSDPSQED